MTESLSGLTQVRNKVEQILNSGRHLSEEESIFLENVRQSLPDIVKFTANEFNLIKTLV